MTPAAISEALESWAAACPSPHARISLAIDDALREAMAARMNAQAISYNQAAREAGDADGSTLRRWLVGKRVDRFGRSQMLSLGKARQFIKWLRNGEAEPAGQTDPLGDDGDADQNADSLALIEARAAALGLATDEQIAAAAGVEPRAVREAFAGTAPPPARLTVWATAPVTFEQSLDFLEPR